LSLRIAIHPPSFSDPAPAPAAPPLTSGVRPARADEPPQAAQPDDKESKPRWGDRLLQWLATTGSWAWFSSAIVHALVLIILSLVILSAPRDEPLWVMGGFDPVPVDDLDAALADIPVEGPTPSLGPFETGEDPALPGPRAATLGSPTGVATAPAVGSALAANPTIDPLAPVGDLAAGRFETFESPLASRGGGLEGRKLANRRATALAGGGTAESEEAVELALAWLAEHHWPDGGWHFDLEQCPTCHGYCRNPGKHTSRTGATGLALLCFLGAGYTHQDGKYQEVVSQGLYFLRSRMTITSHGGDLRDNSAALEVEIPAGGLLGPDQLAAARRDSMYSHGIASLAVTEAYAMTGDKSLREPAEQAVKFIVSAQYADGGWRYNPGFETPGAGDVTVTGWQMTALKSALLAGIDVPYEVWMRASDFLDGVQEDGGAAYRYVRDGGSPRGTAATPIGLLCRMIGGWRRDHRPLQQGAARLGSQAPQSNNVYFNYYASQVLHHVGGSRWEKWNPRLRDYLVGTQAREGHEAGSWYFSEPHSTPGGRLYTTAMATMTLEVYYRYMPLYKEVFVDRTPQ
jgi:hypothetical protein